jgi:4-hydroxy-3-methylbut-2-enyl diphosphate reductase
MNKGIKPVDNPEEIECDGHYYQKPRGVPAIISKFQEKGCINIKDATCPLVKKVHDLAILLQGEGYEIVVFGDPEHPEVIGILGFCGNKAKVVKNVEEASRLPGVNKLGVVSQTTKDEKDFYEVVAVLAAKTSEIRVFNTICSATRKRQEAARELAQRVELMLVIGDKHSSNTGTLVKECKNTGVKTLSVQSADDLEPAWFKGVAKVGITAGASTPDWIIKEVVEKMTQFDDGALQEQKEELANTEIPVEQADPVDVGGEEPQTHEESFAKMEAEMADVATPNRGDIIKGTVVLVKDDEVMVDVGGNRKELFRCASYPSRCQFRP